MNTIDLLDSHGFSNTTFLENTLLASVNGDEDSDSLEWYELDDIRLGPKTFLGPPLGFWSLGQFGSGVQVGVLADFKGVLYNGLFMVPFNGDIGGYLPLPLSDQRNLVEIDEEALFDEFLNTHKQPELSHLSIKVLNLEALSMSLGTGIKRLSFNSGLLMTEKTKTDYEKFLRRSVASSSPDHKLPDSDLFSVNFWLSMRDLFSAKAERYSSCLLTIAENVLFCAYASGTDHKVLISYLEETGDLARRLNHPWLEKYIGCVVEEGGL